MHPAAWAAQMETVFKQHQQCRSAWHKIHGLNLLNEGCSSTLPQSLVRLLASRAACGQARQELHEAANDVGEGDLPCGAQLYLRQLEEQ